MASLAARLSLRASTDAPGAFLSEAAYDEAARNGLFGSEHVEYVSGRLLLKMPQHELHAFALSLVWSALVAASSKELIALATPTVAWNAHRLEPDVALLTRAGYEPRSFVAASRLRLAVEVSVTTLAYDRNEKALYYAEDGIPEYWIVNPEARQIEVFRRPVDGRYAEESLFLPGESFDCLALPGATFDVTALLPEAV